MKKLIFLLFLIPFIGFGQINTFPWTYDFENGIALEQDTTIINNAINSNIYINSTKNVFTSSNVTINTTQSTNVSGATITGI